MAVSSKLLMEAIRNRQCCNDLIHDNLCTTFAIHNIYKFILSNAKYFAPIVILPLLIKIRKLNKKQLLDAWKYYIELVATGSIVGMIDSGMICVLRNILGEFKFYTFVFLPTFISGLVMPLFAPKRVQRMFALSMFQCTIESFLIKRQNFITKSIGESKLLQTALFMCCSSLIMEAKQKDLFKGFWFLIPNSPVASQKNDELVTEPTDAVCSHKGIDCNWYLAYGVRNYLAIGLTLDTFKMLMSPVTEGVAGSSFARILSKFRNFKVRSTAFLASYIGIYRFAHCFLNRKTGMDSEVNHLLASLLGGSCFLFYPKLTLLCYAAVISIQILWNKFVSRTKNSSNEFLEFVKKVPYAKILFPFCLALVVHTYCFDKTEVSKLAVVIINAITNNRGSHIQSNLERIAKSMEANLNITKISTL